MQNSVGPKYMSGAEYFGVSSLPEYEAALKRMFEGWTPRYTLFAKGLTEDNWRERADQVLVFIREGFGVTG